MLAVKCGRRIVRAPRMIKMEARNFYKNMYKQNPIPIINFPHEMVNKISVEEANSQELLPSSDEIKQAVWGCESTRAPGLDGFNFNFIRKCWHLIGDEFNACIYEFFRSGVLPSRANMT